MGGWGLRPGAQYFNMIYRAGERNKVSVRQRASMSSRRRRTMDDTRTAGSRGREDTREESVAVESEHTQQSRVEETKTYM